ncbi:MAG: hypothetical protein GXP22_08005 [Gammaproteobacteria bacterium]|nr:hypothetical protein [Gammaproteobacteria bacterium]
MMKKYLYSAISGLMLSLSVPLAAQSLADVQALSRAGAQQLALKQIDEYQPTALLSVVDWMLWERERLYILQLRKDWDGLIQRVNSYHNDLPRDFMLWAQTQHVKAALEKGESSQARGLLRKLIWDTDYELDSDQLAEWRRLIVRSYLVEQRIEDASISLLRYRQDYGDSHEQEKLLRARVLLRAMRDEEAWQVLQGEDSEWAQALSLLAHLRVGDMTPEAVIKQVYSHMSIEENKTSELAAIWWSIASQAASNQQNLREQVGALEEVLSTEKQYPDDELFFIPADRLWQGYKAWAKQEQWLLGEGGDRYQQALAVKDSDPRKARALFAILALEEEGYVLGQKAHGALVSLLNDRLLQRLYRDSGRYPQIKQLPIAVRYRLIDQALATSDLDGASELMMGLEQPPEGSDAMEWELRRARVLILAGDIDDGVAILGRLMTTQETMTSEVIGRLLQVIFDLQTVNRHESALRLFETLQPKVTDQQQQRELLYWMADSQQSLMRYEKAGWLYLQSAIFIDPFAMDPWAQTARFHAADALVLAGFIEDARNLYQGLFNVTKDEGRRSMLRHKMQQLLLRGI